MTFHNRRPCRPRVGGWSAVILAMALCHLLGAWLVLRTSATATLGLAAGVIAIVTAGTALAARRPARWREGLS